MAKLCERIRYLRDEKGITQQILANHTSVSKSSINMYERGEREPSLETIEAIADYFNVDMEYLIGKSDIPNRLLATPAAPELASDVRDLVTAYDKLNPTGRRKAREFVDDLTENPKYTAAAPTLSGDLLTEMAHDLAKIPTNTK